MKNVADLPDKQRHELFAMTAERRGMGSPAVVEKDFWVCWVLSKIFSHDELKHQLLFKGGTSLAKVYNLIDRFSEDIDLILDWRLVVVEDPMAQRSKTKQAKLNDGINDKAQDYIKDTLLPQVGKLLAAHCSAEIGTEADDFGHVINIGYPETAEQGYLRPSIRLEIGPLASWLPHSEYTIRAYAAEEYPNLFAQVDCPVRAIDARRTFWEKATILHHEANRPIESMTPSRYSRHYYDLFLMSQAAVKEEALNEMDLLVEVAEFKTRFYPRGWARYDLAKPGSLKLVPPERALDALRNDYASMQEMIFGRCPSFAEIIEGLTALESEINKM